MKRFVTAFVFVAAFGMAGPVAAQRDTTSIPSGVRLGLIYQTSYRPEVAVRPLTSAPALSGLAVRVHEILRNDLLYSGRFEVSEVPPELTGTAVDYAIWNGMGVVYLVSGGIEPAAGGYRLRILLHDVVYGRIQELHAFRLPESDAPEFRMTVHSVSDAIVRWLTGEPGMAASRITFVRRNADGSHDLMMVDSDGRNLRRVKHSEGIMFSPAWSADGERVAYSLNAGAGWRIVERDLGTGGERVLVDRSTLNMTPAYAPDGHLAFAAGSGTGIRIFRLDAARACCASQVTSGPRDDLSPTYSPDGEWMAFNSSRIGQPHIYITRVGSDQAEILTPFVYGESGYYTSPDWSPTGSLIAFHGRSKGGFQIMVADRENPGATVRQLTSGGVSEDPSWAPDGRHIVFSGRRPLGRGLFVLDAVSGAIRPLVLGGSFILPDWSPALIRVPDSPDDG